MSDESNDLKNPILSCKQCYYYRKTKKKNAFGFCKRLKFYLPSNFAPICLVFSIEPQIRILTLASFDSKKGTATRIDTTSSAEIIASPDENYHLELRGFIISVDADEIVTLRWGGATGDIIAMLPTKGVIAMNLINIDEKGAGEASPENLYLKKSGSGNCQGTVWTEEVAD